MLLSHTRGLRAFEQLQRDHEWGRGELVLSAIKGLTMGIVGFGNIGRAIARRATGFEMRVLAVDAEAVPAGEGVEEVWPLSRLNDLCRESDVLAIAAPITPTSRANAVSCSSVNEVPITPTVLPNPAWCSANTSV